MTEKKATSEVTGEQDLNQQTAKIEWQELIKHFARGVVIRVNTDLDLIDVAHKMANDNVPALQTWLDSGSVRRASDDDARDWTKRQPLFWCVVAAPWVLVQEITGTEALTEK